MQQELAAVFGKPSIVEAIGPEEGVGRRTVRHADLMGEPQGPDRFIKLGQEPIILPANAIAVDAVEEALDKGRSGTADRTDENVLHSNSDHA
jgi:hypothetical protein